MQSVFAIRLARCPTLSSPLRQTFRPPLPSAVHRASFRHVGRFSTVTPLRAQLGRIPIQRVSPDQIGGPLPEAEGSLPPPHAKLRPGLLRPILFCTLVAGGVLVAAAEATNRDTARWRALLRDRTIGFFGSGEPRDSQLAATKRAAEVRKAQETMGSTPSLGAAAANWWIRLSEGKQTAAMLVAANGLVFLAWQVQSRGVRLHMIKHWLHYPLSGRSHTILTSTFSHSTFWHYGLNMVALYSLGSTFHDYLSQRVRHAYDPTSPAVPESTPRYHFLAFLVTAGLASGLATHAYSLLVRAPRILKYMQGVRVGTTPSPILPSLGISGAVYACLTGTALAFPDASVSLIFLPMVAFPIGTATLALVAVDFVGLVRGWRTFDHAAHLGGALFGAIWYKYGGELFDRLRLWRWKEVAEAVERERSKKGPPAASSSGERQVFNPSSRKW